MYIGKSLMYSTFECECDQMYAAKMSKMTDFRCVFQVLNTPKFVFGWTPLVTPPVLAGKLSYPVLD